MSPIVDTLHVEDNLRGMKDMREPIAAEHTKACPEAGLDEACSQTEVGPFLQDGPFLQEDQSQPSRQRRPKAVSRPVEGNKNQGVQRLVILHAACRAFDTKVARMGADHWAMEQVADDVKGLVMGFHPVGEV